MAKPADKPVSLAELRFRPANSNHAARAVLSHHFVNVPRCSFASDDGISCYLGSETGMQTFPASPDTGAPQDVDVPAIHGEMPEAAGSRRRKPMRGGLALSVLLHVALAAALGFATLSIPDKAEQEEGTLSVTLVTRGTADVDASLTGDEEAMEQSPDKPADDKPEEVKKPFERAEKPVEARPVEKPAEVLPVPGADLPEILTSRESRTETEAVVPLKPTEKKAEPAEKPAVRVAAEKLVNERQPGKKPKAVEKKIAEKKEPLKKAEPGKKDKAHEKRQRNQGNRGNASMIGTKGDVDAKDKGRSSTRSKGALKNDEIGKAAETNYKGLVTRKLSRAKGRMRSPARGRLWVTFTILSDGSISGLAVTRSSGKPALDAAALKVVRAASPFPPIPAETGRKRWEMSVPMTFTGK
jgi:protein TonB